MVGKQTLSLKYFKDLVQKRTGLTFDNTREEILRQKIAEVMGQRSYKSRAELFNSILNNDHEFLAFVNHLTINETYFFREPQYLKLLTNHLVPELLTRKPIGAKLKIISAGCSTGEEPYSIAMSLLEKYGANTAGLFSLIGIDINSIALEKATEGIYGKLSFRNDEGQLNTSYFDKGKYNLYKIKPLVKELVSFQRVNLLNNFFPIELAGADIIFYRNVSIYFDSATQQKILSGLASLLNNEGYVVFSSSETFSHKDIGKLTLIERQGLFFYQKKMMAGAPGVPAKIKEMAARKSATNARPNSLLTAKGKNLSPGILSQTPAKKHVTPEKKKPSLHGPAKKIEPELMFKEAVDFLRKKENAQALALVVELKKIEAFAGKAYLLEGCILLNAKKYADAEFALGQALKRDELDLDAHMMLGLIAKNNGETAKAIQCFMKALYVRNSCWMAHYFLAEIHQSCRDLVKATRYYDSVLKILEKETANASGLTFFPISFHRHDLIHLCRKKIAQLQAY
ncbi:MAG: hypothetical protein KKB30_04780 [Proteobacteria bacterium]|nr:hypothetical protein [Pseudomonadota bacterium]MBU1715478.1 hypothetical protein [Pseudomonadota bacterium]